MRLQKLPVQNVGLNLNQKNNLRLDFCSREAALFAVKHWHYSKTLPASKLFKIGVWENQKFIGCVIYSYGANPQIGKPYGLKQTEICELTRVALAKHQSSVSKIVAISLKILKRENPKLKLVISYADKDQNHLGVIYQASNWIYVGLKNVNTVGSYLINGEKKHNKNITDLYGKYSDKKQTVIEWAKTYLDPKAEKIYTKGKHKYIYIR